MRVRVKESLLNDALEWIKSAGVRELAAMELVNAGVVGSERHCREVLMELIRRGTGVTKIGTVGKKVRYAMREDAKRITWDDVWKMMDNS